MQTREYIGFIKNFTESTNIMTKSFFVVVPYTQLTLTADTGIFKGLFSKKNNAAIKAEKELDFEEKRSQLEQRVSVIVQGLARCGVKAVTLGTEEVVEVFYKVFNPGELEGKIEIEQQ